MLRLEGYIQKHKEAELLVFNGPLNSQIAVIHILETKHVSWCDVQKTFYNIYIYIYML